MVLETKNLAASSAYWERVWQGSAGHGCGCDIDGDGSGGKWEKEEDEEAGKEIHSGLERGHPQDLKGNSYIDACVKINKYR